MQQVQELRTIVHNTRSGIATPTRTAMRCKCAPSGTRQLITPRPSACAGHERISRLVLVMTVLGALLLLVLVAITTAMLIIWGQKVQPCPHGRPWLHGARCAAVGACAFAILGCTSETRRT
jgi:hypothetical protein